MSEERLKEIKDNIGLRITNAKLKDVKTASNDFNEELELYNEVIRLKEENNILKELNVCVGCENNYHKREIAGIQVVVSGETYNEYKGTLQDQISELENRIDKAIEYIENTPLYTETYDYNMEDNLELNYVSDEKASDDLLDILRGEDK